MCPKCGTVKKSGKISCCGVGGSWFKSCESTGNLKLRHTWYEGIQACKSRIQSKIVIAQQKHMGSSRGADMVSYKAVIAFTEEFSFTSVKNNLRYNEGEGKIWANIF